jgi:2-oxoglutarate ferredoxin oxidoreductase subunit alpha
MKGAVIGIVGSASDGILEAGETLINAFAQEGYFATLCTHKGTQIRGGEVSCRIRVATTPVLNSGGALDLAVVLNWEDYSRLSGELIIGAETVVVYDKKTGLTAATLPLGGVKPAAAVAIPITEMAIHAGAPSQSKDCVVLGLLAAWLGLPQKKILESITARTRGKADPSPKVDQKAFASGIEFATRHTLGRDMALDRATAAGGRRRVADGNEMCARAALFAGCKFFAGYPISPATEIMHYLQREIGKYGGSFLQAEDEIAAAAAAVGASYAGAKAMTATSGPGFSLQTEVLGLASAVELPLVCVNVQRGGPATGMPSTQEQADLFAATFSSPGDTVRPVLAPTSVADTFDVTVEAFNIAEHYQTPVIVLTDRDLAQCKAVLEPIEPSQFRIIDRMEPTKAELKKYARFQITEAGISPISHPGMRGGSYLAAGLEHDERGVPTSSGEVHAQMTRKRLSKLNSLKQRRDLFLFEGDPDAHIGLVSWGNVSGITREAVRIARASGIKVKLLVPRLLYPVAEAVYEDFFASLRRCVVVEQSHQGQLHRILKMWTNTPHEFMSVSKSGANRISPHEIVKLIQAMEQPVTDRFRTHYCDLLNVI